MENITISKEIKETSTKEDYKSCVDIFIENFNSLKINTDETNQNINSLIQYFEKLEPLIRNILLRPEKELLTYDILDTEKFQKNKLIALKEKHRQMKNGEIWQEVIGNYDNFINLKTGHESGLDILSHTRKIAIELKNRTNTDNSTSRKGNYDKLVKFKQKNPDYICIYANINDSNQKKTLQGSNKKIIHNGFEIETQVGYEFLNFIFEEKTQQIIEFVRNTLDKYT